MELIDKNIISKIVQANQHHQLSALSLDLMRFKMRISQVGAACAGLYTERAPVTRVYRLIFILLSALFFSLSFIVLFHVPSFYYHSLLGHSQLYTMPLSFLSFVCGACCALVGVSIRIEKEVMFHIVHHARRRLKSFYFHRIYELGIFGFIPLGTACLSKRKTKIQYLQALIEIKRKKQETGLILRKIGEQVSLENSEKEKLFNEVLFELESALEKIITQFQTQAN